MACGVLLMVAVQRYAEGLWRGDSAVTTIEYAILAGVIASALILVLSVLGTQLAAMFNKIAAAFA
jgi:Flp pilus assembly pilin Flp